MTLHTHITPVDRDWVAAANAQDQAEADRIIDDLDTLGIGFDARGKWHGDSLQTARGAWNGTMLVLAFYAALAIIALAVKYGPVIWRML